MRAGQIILVRHGRTDANSSGILQGRVDNPLNAEGERQAADVAAHLARRLVRTGGAPPRIVSSPLARARQTAAHIESAFNGGTGVEVDDRWLELDYGIFDGRALSTVPDDLWHRWRTDDSFVPEGGESLSEVHQRVTAACEELLELGDTVVVVSHVSPIKSAVAWALGASPALGWRTHLDNASISRINLGPRGAALAGFNEIGHLG